MNMQLNATTEQFVNDVLETVLPDFRERVKLAVLAIMQAQEGAVALSKVPAAPQSTIQVRKPRGMAALSPEKLKVVLAKALATRKRNRAAKLHGGVKLNMDGTPRKPKGMAALSPEQRKVVVAKAKATRARHAAERMAAEVKAATTPAPQVNAPAEQQMAATG